MCRCLYISNILAVRDTNKSAITLLSFSFAFHFQTKESEIYELTCELEELRQQVEDKDQEISQVNDYCV